MRYLWYYAVFLLLMIVFFGHSGTAYACPLCKDAIAASDSDEEINNAPLAYNQGIYLMVGVPYLLLGGVGYFIYRGCQRNAAYLESRQT